jgi:hypothetical protein
MRRSALAAVLITSVALLGCGGSGGGDEQAVKTTVTQFMAALANGDGAKACSLATAQAQQRLTAQGAQAGTSCPAIISAISKRLPPQIKQGLQTAKVKKASVNGDTATVADKDISSSAGNLGPFLGGGSTTLKKENGTWKLSS